MYGAADMSKHEAHLRQSVQLMSPGLFTTTWEATPSLEGGGREGGTHRTQLHLQ
jgi:hypothetical protein